MSERFPRPAPRRVTEASATAHGRDVELRIDGLRMALPQDVASNLARALIDACAPSGDVPEPDAAQSGAPDASDPSATE